MIQLNPNFSRYNFNNNSFLTFNPSASMHKMQMRFVSSKIGGFSSKIQPVSSVISVKSGLMLERDSNKFLSNMENLLGSIIKRQFHSKTPTFPKPFNPNNLGLDFNSRENIKNKNDSLVLGTPPSKLLNEKINTEGKESPILKKTHSFRGTNSTKYNPEFKRIDKAIERASHKNYPNMIGCAREKFALTNFNNKDERENDNPMIFGAPLERDKNRVTLKSLYKRRSINNLRKIGLRTPFYSQIKPKSLTQRSEELFSTKTKSVFRKGLDNSGSTIKYRNRKSRANFWENFWTNRLTKIKVKGAINYAKLILGVSGRDTNLHKNPKLMMLSHKRSRKMGKAKGLSLSKYINQALPLITNNLGLSKTNSNFNLKPQIYPSPLKNLWLSYLNQKRLNILNKHTFNTFLANSKVVNYSFFKTAGATNSISLSTPKSLSLSRERDSYGETVRVSGTYASNQISSTYSLSSSSTLKSLYKLLKSFFKSVKSIISYPILHVSPNKLIINLFYYVKPTRQKIKNHKYYQKHIRKEGKLFKDNLLRSKFNKLKHRFNFILLLNKWSRAVIVNNTKGTLASLYNNSIIKSQEVALKITLPLKDEIKGTPARAETKIEQNKSVKFDSAPLRGLRAAQAIDVSKSKDSQITELISYISKTENYKSKAESLGLSLLEGALSSANTKGGRPALLQGRGADGQSLKIAEESASYPLGMIPNKVNKESETVRYNLYLWVRSFIRSRLIINLFTQLNSEKETTGPFYNFKDSLLSTMFFLNFITQLAAPARREDLSELSTITDQIEEEIRKRLDLVRTKDSPIVEADILSLKLDKLEKLEKILDTTSLFLSEKLLKALINKKDKLVLLKEQTLKGLDEILIIINEEEFELLEQPKYYNYNNSRANVLFFIKNTLHELYRNTLRLSLSAQSALVYNSLSLQLISPSLTKGKNKSLTSNLQWEHLLLKAKTTPSNTLKDRIQGENNTRTVDNSLSSAALLTNNSKAFSSLRSLPRIVSLNLYKFKFLISFLEKLFNKPIELNLIRLKYPYHESNILAQVLALSSKKYKFFLIMRKLFYTASIKHPGKASALAQTSKTDMFNIIPSYLSGLKVRLAGRLLTEKLIPRKTVKTFQLGSLSRGKVNFKTTSRITLKNKRGAYSFTVTTSHLLVNSKESS